jgi:ComF family protein
MNLVSLADFFLPRLCLSCDCKLNQGEDTVCPQCLSSFRKADPKRISIEYDRKFLVKGYISGFNSVYIFEKNKGLQQLMHALKYGKKFRAGEFLGKLTASHLAPFINTWNIDLIIPVPLHKLKKISRGYNQSFYVAKGIASVTGKPVDQKSIKRIKNTLTQTMMNLPEREANIKGAFKLRKSKLAGKRILLVDDVITTGSTLNECSRILLEGGAEKVFAVSPAIADLDHKSI